MTERNPDDTTLLTLHEDLTAGFAEMRSGFTDLKGEIRSGFADMKATLIAGFRSLPTRESSEEMVRLLQERNRLRLDALIRGRSNGERRVGDGGDPMVRFLRLAELRLAKERHGAPTPARQPVPRRHHRHRG